MKEYSWDVFISHASEDKDSFVRPLAEALRKSGLRVWYDEHTLALGDSLRRKIDQGLSNSRYGVVVLSPYFFAKEWPQRELDGLANLETYGGKIILPVWHGVRFEDVQRFSPTLADRVACSTARGIEAVVSEITSTIQTLSRDPSDNFPESKPKPFDPRPSSDPGETRRRRLPAAIRTAILRDQLKLLRELEEFLRQDSESSLHEKFGFSQAVELNAMAMIAAYAEKHLGLKARNPMFDVEGIQFQVHPETLVIPFDSPHSLSAHDQKEASYSWSEYSHILVGLPPKLLSALRRIRHFRGSPMLPLSLAPSIDNLLQEIDLNIEAIRSALNECAAEIPEAYPTAESLEAFNTHWIWNRFIKHASDLSKPVAAILHTLRQYYQESV